jgi:hypothetical protein
MAQTRRPKREKRFWTRSTKCRGCNQSGQFDLLKEIKFGQIRSVYMYVIFSDFRLIVIGSG